jgi:hypothetical protein
MNIYFYTALTHDPKYLMQYEFLVQSIGLVYPEAVPILYLFDDFRGRSIKRLKRANPRLIVEDRRELFDPNLGFDTNFVRGLAECYRSVDGPVISLDADMLVRKNFDDLLNSEFDVIATTRGYYPVEPHGRNDICFGISIYSRRKPESVSAFLDELLARAMKWNGKSERPVFEVQTEINNIFSEADNSLLDGYPYKAFTSTDAIVPAKVGSIRIGQTDVVLKVVDTIELGCEYPPRYHQAKVIHYKSEKRRCYILFKKYCLNSEITSRTELWNSIRYNPRYLRKWKRKLSKLSTKLRVAMKVGQN